MFLQASEQNYSTLVGTNPTNTRFSTSNTNKADPEFFVGEPAKYESLQDKKFVTPKAVFLEKEDYSYAKDVLH